MNNAKLAIDTVSLEFEGEAVDRKPELRQREGQLVKIIEALGQVEQSEDWKVLEKNVFGGVVEALERRRKDEAARAEINAPELYRLQGQLAWAKKYADLGELTTAFKVELKNVRTQIKNG